MAQPQEGQQTTATVLHEIDLGQHHLFLLSDQSIDLMRDEQTPYVADNVLSLDNGEAYRLMISLQEMFKEAREYHCRGEWNAHSPHLLKE